MGQKFTELSEKVTTFIKEQNIYFVATAAADGRVNVSPKGLDSLRVVNKNRVVWLNVTGSGNETAAHVEESGRMTIMFCSFTGPPLVVRLYGTAKVVHLSDPEWSELYACFDPLPGARQIFDLSIDLVHTSCGMAVPYFDFAGEREELTAWAEKKGPEGLRKYWREKNRTTIDGKETHIVEKNR